MKTLISIVVITGIIAVIGAVVVGVKSFDGTVTAKPYEEGLVWDETQRELAELGWRAEIKGSGFKTGENELIFSVLDKKSNTLDLDQSITVLLSRPSTDSYDMVFNARENDEGLYEVSVQFPLYGYWDVKLNIVRDEDDIMIQKRVFVEKG
jgi:nitrogen fixation protein FixH